MELHQTPKILDESSFSRRTKKHGQMMKSRTFHSFLTGRKKVENLRFSSSFSSAFSIPVLSLSRYVYTASGRERRSGIENAFLVFDGRRILSGSESTEKEEKQSGLSFLEGRGEKPSVFSFLN